MRYGEVVQVRIPSEDIMTCIDVVAKSPLAAQYGMSLAQVVKWSLHYLCAAARDSGAVPSRDGFEYSEMLKPFRQLQAGKAGRSARAEVSIGLGEIDRAIAASDSRLANPITSGGTPSGRATLVSTGGDQELSDSAPPQFHVGQVELGEISHRVMSPAAAFDRVNLDLRQVALFLIHRREECENDRWREYFTSEQLHEAEAVIKDGWLQYPALVG